MSVEAITDTAALQQRTEAWLLARLGKVTGSRVADAVKRTKTGWSTERQKYMDELAIERAYLAGRPNQLPAGRFRSTAMKWGSDTEPQARAAYAFHRDCDVAQVGFVAHPFIDMAGCSPDGLIGADGMVQIKCPNPGTHWASLRTGVVDPAYVTQVQWEMACTGRDWSDFVSFDPELPARYSIFVKRIERAPDLIAALEADVGEFLAELDAQASAIAALYPDDVPE